MEATLPPRGDMSSATLLDAPAQRMSSGSVQTLTSRPLQPVADPSASKRVCFYRSGDPKFAGHRVVINGRTFKSFDALLDALSRKVPLPFGVRTISTPRGTHSVRGLEDLHDGGSYVCSDRRRVKPLNLEAAQRRRVPWNTTRPPSSGGGRRRGGGRSEGPQRADKAAAARVSVRTPKRLLVVKNKDATVKRTVVLQKRTAPTFDALLDYLSQVMQFPVLKLYTADGRRVDGLAALILCSGVIVAAGNEPFRLGNYNIYTLSNSNAHTTTYMSQSANSEAAEPLRLQPLAYTNKPNSSGRGSRNFSLSSERYLVNQINRSLNGSISSHQHPHNGSPEADPKGNHAAIEMDTWQNASTQEPPHTCILPQDEDIEKTFRVNQDGSMTVEMRVRLTIKEEELLHWTTTLSRSCLNRRTACASMSGTDNSSPDSDNAVAKDPSGVCRDAPKEDNRPATNGKSVGFGGERSRESSTPAESDRCTSGFKHNLTPGPHHISKNTSVESIKTVTDSGVQESTIGRYSYTQKTPEAEVTEAYCVVRHNNTTSSSGGSSRPVPHPRRPAAAAAAAGAHDQALQPADLSTPVADILRVENNGVEVTETVMHIYERQGAYYNLAKNECVNERDAQGNPSSETLQSEPASADSRPPSGSSECDVDFTPPSTTTDSLHRPKEMFSLSSEPISLERTSQIHNGPPSKTNPKGIPAKVDAVGKQGTARGGQKKKATNPTGKKKSSPSSSNSEAKEKDSKTTSGSSGEKLSDHNAGKKSGSSSGSGQKGQAAGKETDLLQTAKKGRRSDKASSEKQAISPNTDKLNGLSAKRESRIRERAPRENGFNINIPEKDTTRPPMKKNLVNIVQPKPVLGKKGMKKSKSMSEKKITSPKRTIALSESVSMPVIKPSPAEVNLYVEKWLLTQMSPDSVPYTEEAAVKEPEPPTNVVFEIGGDTDSANECQTNTSGHPNLLHGDALLTSTSFLPVPGCQKGSTTDNALRARGLCVSMPSVRIDPSEQEKTMRMHRSSEAIGPAGNEQSSHTSNLLSSQATLKPVLRQLCSSIQCIRRASEFEDLGNIKKSNSLVDFSTQVASVFGSPSRALVSFLSAMTLRETLKAAVAGESHGSRSPSEAMLVMESLQKISTIEDESLQRSSLTDLQNRTSSGLKDSWRDFQEHRQRLQSEPMSPKFSEQEFALDVVSEAGDIFADQCFGINDIMEELNMPQDLREEISSTFQQTKSFYPEEEESTFFVREINHSESEEELEQFHEKPANEMKQSQELDSFAITEETENSQVPGEELNGTIERQSLCQEQNDLLSDSKQGVDEGQEMKVAGKTDTWRKHEEQSKHRENCSELGLENDECDSEISVNTKKEDEVEQDSMVDRYEERSTELEDEVTGEKDGDIEKQDMVQKDETKLWKEEEASSVDEGQDINKGILTMCYEDKEWCEQSIDEKEQDEGQTETEFTEDSRGEATEDGSGELGFTDEDNKGDEEFNEVKDRKQDIVEGNCVEDELEEENSGESTEDAAEKETGEESGEESDEERCRGENEEEGKDTEDDEDLEAEQEVEGEQSSDEGKEDDVEEHALDLSVRVEETYELYDGEEEETDRIADADVSSCETGDEEKKRQISQQVEISQELIDFVNAALQSSSLVCTYDTLGNVRIEPDQAKVIHTKRMEIPKSKEDSLYGRKQLPSPSTSDLSDYRPETSASGGYNTQESIDIITESGDELEHKSPEHGNSTRGSETVNQTADSSHSSLKSKPEQRIKPEGTFSSSPSGTKASRDGLSYCSAASSPKADPEVAKDAAELYSNDGILIDKGRWLLKENHLIRKSPPALMGMYDDVDSSGDITSEDFPPPQSLTDQHPLAVISSSDLEEMAKPHGPKCSYYNMPHGSDSDPFLEDDSFKSSKRESRNGKGKVFKVSPTIDTSKTWLKKNGSLSSFASVEFKMQDSRVHPEGDPTAAGPARSPPSGALQAPRSQGSVELFNGKCGQYCPIL